MRKTGGVRRAALCLAAMGLALAGAAGVGTGILAGDMAEAPAAVAAFAPTDAFIPSARVVSFDLNEPEFIGSASCWE